MKLEYGPRKADRRGVRASLEAREDGDRSRVDAASDRFPDGAFRRLGAQGKGRRLGKRLRKISP